MNSLPSELIPLSDRDGHPCPGIVGIVVFYLIVRLRFALFECLIHQSVYLTPGWRRYREQAWRFFLFSIVIAVGFLALAVAALAPFASRHHPVCPPDTGRRAF